MTIKEALRFGAAHLTKNRLRSPRQDTEVILTSILRKARGFLYTFPELTLSPQEECLFRDWLSKRCLQYPLQYLRGTQEFYGRGFAVKPGVFIPRPETELLIDASLEFLEGRPEAHLLAADIGTGCGCIAITLACEDSRLWLVATDVSDTALQVARPNAKTHDCLNRIEFCQGSILDPVKNHHGRYHLLVSNPPYVSALAEEHLEASVKKYEPKTAIIAGSTGQEAYVDLFRQAPNLLHPGGQLIVELGYDNRQAVTHLARTSGWFLAGLRKDLAGIDRCAIFELNIEQG